jgi:RNA polymerase sigma-70 factor (ECF subfamily)
VANGEQAALRVLYDRHGPRVLAVALRVLRTKMEAEEVVQDTFIEVWKRAREYDPVRGSVSGWVTTMARNRAIDRLRTRGSEGRTSQAFAGEPPASPRATPLEDVEQRLARDRIGAALAELPGEQRAAIELAYFEGLSQREIAERTGEPLGTVKTRVRLAMAKLTALLGGAQ